MAQNFKNIFLKLHLFFAACIFEIGNLFFWEFLRNRGANVWFSVFIFSYIFLNRKKQRKNREKQRHIALKIEKKQSMFRSNTSLIIKKKIILRKEKIERMKLYYASHKNMINVFMIIKGQLVIYIYNTVITSANMLIYNDTS